MRWAPGLTLVLFLGPIATGLLGTLLPAFGWLPALGGRTFSLAPWRELFAAPGLATALRVTLVTGIATTAVSLSVVVFTLATLGDAVWVRRCQAMLAPLLAVPHAALAIGFAFLASPSGWIARLLSPGVTGWHRPPDLATIQDPDGIALVLGLVLKEVPFLFLMGFAALGQIRARAVLAAAYALGYGPIQAWIKLVFPLIYPQIRLPIYAVLAFSLSTVDVALILGPSTPPPLAPLVVRWFTDRDILMYFPAAAGAVLQLLLVAGAIGAWRCAEPLVAGLARRWIARGRRGGDGRFIAACAQALSALIAITSVAALTCLLVWSFASAWRFPDALPGHWTLDIWRQQSGALLVPLRHSLIAAGMATILATLLVIACLENEQRSALRPGSGALWLIYLPLLIPQTAFLFGVQMALVWAGLDGTWFGVVWCHLLFVVPYMFLSLSDPFRALDGRYARAALCLGASPWRVLIRVKLPILLRPLLVSVAIGFAISIGLYLPTLFAGAGRFETLTTEAVTLSSGGDRRVVSVFAFVQAMLPLVVYGAALATPRWLHRNRRALEPAS